MKALACIPLAVAALVAPAYSQAEKGFVSLFDGKTLDGWKFSGNKDAFTVADGAIVAKGDCSHAFYSGSVGNGIFDNFELRLDVMTKPNSNGGVFIHSAWQQGGWPSKGYEVQVNNTHSDWRKSGGLYNIADNKEAFKDDTWMAYIIRVENGIVTVTINGREIVKYNAEEGKNMLQKGGGAIALQAHDPGSTVLYKNIRIKVLPAPVVKNLNENVKITVKRTDSDLKFNLGLALPSDKDAATAAKFTLVDGQRDGNGAELTALNDGKVPGSADEPRSNFFFAGGTSGGRVSVDLGNVISVKAINSYSWHNGSRAPQVYKVYGSDGKSAGFQAEPKGGANPKSAGWALVGSVDTRDVEGDGTGQYAVSVSGKKNPDLGNFRYLLFDFEPTETGDAFGNTFYSEIDVIDSKAPAIALPPPPKDEVKVHAAKDGKFRYRLDVAKAPDLAEWTEKELLPIVEEWYPKLVEMLPSNGYKAPTEVTLEYRDDMGGTPAYALGSKVSLNVGWFRKELKGEAKGSVIHELVHVVQNYWRAARTNRNPSPTPGWITEGIPDYIRWFLYEPQTRGAEMSPRAFENAKYDGSYRVSGNFLNWVTLTYDKQLVQKLNEAAREGKYNEDLWKKWTGKTVQELGEEWKKAGLAGAAKK